MFEVFKQLLCRNYNTKTRFEGRRQLKPEIQSRGQPPLKIVQGQQDMRT